MKNDIIKTNEQGNLIVISGPSGCGKGTVIRKLLDEDFDHNLWLSVSMTSRKIRSNDVVGQTYFFVSRKEFESRINQGEFLEYALYNDNYYGTPKDKIMDQLNQGKDVILEIEIQGALKVQEMVPEAIFIFILPPNMEELKRRLIERKTDSPENILKRFVNSYREINEITKYNYVVVNDQVEDAVKKIQAILMSERSRVDRIMQIYTHSIEEKIHEAIIEFDGINTKYPTKIK